MMLTGKEKPKPRPLRLWLKAPTAFPSFHDSDEIKATGSSEFTESEFCVCLELLIPSIILAPGYQMFVSGLAGSVFQKQVSCSQRHTIQIGNASFGLEISKASDEPPLVASKETPIRFSCRTGHEEAGYPPYWSCPHFQFAGASCHSRVL